MAKKSYKALHTLHGNYGLAHAGDVIELEETHAKHLLDAGIVEETKKEVTHPEKDVEAENKAIDEKHKNKGFIEDKTEKKQIKHAPEKKHIKKPGS